MQLFYAAEVATPELLSLDTHGSFIAHILRDAVVLHGENPFGRLPSSESVAVSVVAKLQYYAFRLRQAALGVAPVIKNAGSDPHRKKLALAAQDLLLLEGHLVPAPQAVTAVGEKYPGIFGRSGALMNATEPLTEAEALPLFEALYAAGLERARPTVVPERKPRLIALAGMSVEHLAPETDSARAIVLCDGLPGTPYQRLLMSRLASAGWHVLFPRYRGTWESAGTFLEASPADDVARLVGELRAGGAGFACEQVMLIGTSFGGTVALEAAASADGVVALSPVPDLGSFVGLASLGAYLRSMHAGSYRFDDEGWAALSAGTLLRVDRTAAASRPCLLAAGSRDEEVTEESVRALAHDLGAEFIAYPGVGHLSFSKLQGAVLDDVLTFLDKAVSTG